MPFPLPYREGAPLLTLTSIKCITELHPFFYTLVRLSQSSASGQTLDVVDHAASSSGHENHTPSPGTVSNVVAAGTNEAGSESTGADNTNTLIDSVVEIDFLEETMNS